MTSLARRLTDLHHARVEDLMEDLKEDYTIVIVTHNMQQARPRKRHDRMSDASTRPQPTAIASGILAEFSRPTSSLPIQGTRAPRL